MINEAILKDVLIASLAQNKMVYAMVSVALDEVAALQETVRALDPTFSETLEAKRVENSTSAERVALLQSMNVLIRKVEETLLG
jgi:hypothetical protein